MVIKSRFTASIPECSVQQWILGSPHARLAGRKAWIDADYPDTSYLTAEDTRLLAKRIAVGLLGKGLQPGARVLLFCGNSIYYPVLVLAIWMAEGIFTGANPASVTRELAHQLCDSGACMMIAAEELEHTALEAARLANLSLDRLFLFDGKMNAGLKVRRDGGVDDNDGDDDDDDDDDADCLCPHWSELVAARWKGELFQWPEPLDSKITTCALNYSSGTTGVPKGVEVTHYNVIANAIGMITINRLRRDYEDLRRRAAGLCILPMYHAYGLQMFVTLMQYEQIPVYVMPTFDFNNMLACIEKFRITLLFAIPPVYVHMMKHPRARRVDLSSLETIASGAAPLAGSVQDEFNRMLAPSGSKLRQGWGMTELTCTALAWDPTRSSVPGVGELLPDCQAKLLDVESGQEIVEAYKPGELLISSPSTMRCYWRQPQATAEAITTAEDGTRWLRTGDVAYAEEYKAGAIFHIVDRFKELIKVKGFQVAPAELEALLLERPDVADVAVVGVANASGELPRAYVVLKPGAKASEADVASWLAERVAPYKRLTGGVAFVDAIPKSPSGKILRKTLRDRANSPLSSPRPRL